jgi:hypothetical protein
MQHAAAAAAALLLPLLSFAEVSFIGGRMTRLSTRTSDIETG